MERMNEKPEVVVKMTTRFNKHYSFRYNIHKNGDGWECETFNMCGDITSIELIDFILRNCDILKVSTDEFIQMMDGINDESIVALSMFLKEKTLAYDKSPAINQFKYKGYTDWWDKSTRISIRMKIGDEQAVGISFLSTEDDNLHERETLLWIGNKPFYISFDEAKRLLSEVESYANKCFNATQRLLLSIANASTIDELKSINIEDSYPVVPMLNDDIL